MPALVPNPSSCGAVSPDKGEDLDPSVVAFRLVLIEGAVEERVWRSGVDMHLVRYPPSIEGILELIHRFRRDHGIGTPEEPQNRTPDRVHMEDRRFLVSLVTFGNAAVKPDDSVKCRLSPGLTERCAPAHAEPNRKQGLGSCGSPKVLDRRRHIFGDLFGRHFLDVRHEVEVFISWLGAGRPPEVIDSHGIDSRICESERQILIEGKEPTDVGQDYNAGRAGGIVFTDRRRAISAELSTVGRGQHDALSRSRGAAADRREWGPCVKFVAHAPAILFHETVRLMRLLIVTNDFPPTVGGIENYTYSLARRWPADETTVVTRTVPGCDEFDQTLDFEVHRHPTSLLLPTPGLLSRLRRYIRERNVEVVHFPSALPLGVLGKRLGLPYAVSVHGGEFMLASRLPGVRQVLKSVINHASVAFPQSSFAEDLVRRFAPGVPMQRVTCGVDPERYGRDSVDAVKIEAGPVIVCVSRLVARKGPRTLIKALPLIGKVHSDARLLIVGDGPDRAQLENLADSLGVEQAVTFAGAVPWENVPSYYAAGDVFALPTRTRFFGTETEGLPLVFVEAAASGLPLVGGDAGGVRDAVREGVTGHLVDGGSVEETAGAIVKLLDDPTASRAMGGRARQMVLEEFTWDAIFQKYARALFAHIR